VKEGKCERGKATTITILLTKRSSFSSPNLISLIAITGTDAPMYSDSIALVLSVIN
jgi:hypothetical protein